MDLPLTFGFHPHVQQDGSGDVAFAISCLVRRAPHDVAVDAGVRHRPHKDVLGGGDERQRGRAVDASRLEIGEEFWHRCACVARLAKSIIAEAAVGVEDEDVMAKIC